MSRETCRSCFHFTVGDCGETGDCRRYSKTVRKFCDAPVCGEYAARREVTEEAARELREVARFLDENAEALVGDMDSTFVLDTGLRFEFRIMERDSIATVRVTKEHYAMGRR